MACPGSVKLSRGIPDQTSEYAAEGTLAHEVSEFSLANEVSPFSHGKVTPGMAESVQLYLDHCRALKKGASHVWIERRVSLEAFGPPTDMDGTADFIAIKDRTLHVVDLKYGQGVAVEAKDNAQLKYYAAAALGEMGMEGLGSEIDRVVCTIVQPRAPHPDGPIRSIEMVPAELVDFALDLIDAARLALKEDAPLYAGKHCRWCKALPRCPEARRNSMEVARIEFSVSEDSIQTPLDPRLMSPEQVGALIYQFETAETWMNAVRAHAYGELEAGRSIPGFKLVAKRPARKYTDEKAVEAWGKKRRLKKDELYDISLKSPKQLEMVVGKGNLPEELVVSISTGFTLAEESDPRPAVHRLTAGEEFTAEPHLIRKT